jgi:molybdopterin/thiamine biosynthesis adenylyltransferase
MNIKKLITNEFSRNIGLLSEADQEKLLNSRMAIAGAGGVGGLHIMTLARLGVGRFTIADPDTFEAANVSRQFGAFGSTFNLNKAEVLARMVQDINPEAEIRIMTKGVTDDNIDDFLDHADIFVDGIEFFEIEIRRRLFQKAYANNIYAITSAPLGFGSTLQVFAPGGMTFDQYFGICDAQNYEEKIASFAAGLAPNPYHIKYMDLSKINFSRRKGPAVAPACTLAASLLGTEVVRIITRKGPVHPVPRYLQFDMLKHKYRYSRLWWGGKNPLHRLKRSLILSKIIKQIQEEER